MRKGLVSNQAVFNEEMGREREGRGDRYVKQISSQRQRKHPDTHLTHIQATSHPHSPYLLPPSLPNSSAYQAPVPWELVSSLANGSPPE